MSLFDILFRVDEICNKYEKYDPDKQRELNASVDDAFSRLYSIVDAEIENAFRKSEMAAIETSRANKVAMNAEIWRTKARLVEEVVKLQKLATKKMKGLSKEDMIARNDMVIMLPDRIMAIPEGDMSSTSKTSGIGAFGSGTRIKFDSPEGNFNKEYYEESEQSSQFRQEYEMRKMKQDEGLDFIAEGLDTLKNLAIDMNEELDRQVPMMDEIDERVEKATSGIRKNNVRLKENLLKMRSSRNFCIDIILLSVILGIAAYLYNVLR